LATTGTVSVRTGLFVTVMETSWIGGGFDALTSILAPPGNALPDAPLRVVWYRSG
jgi:hypothetical protein